MAKTGKRTSVFLSYSRESVERARALQAELESLGFDVWRDQTSLYGGERWPKSLGDAIANSHVLVLLWSESASRSDFVELEWCTALALSKPIVPILLEPSPLPSSLSAVQALPADIASGDLARSLRQVVRSRRFRVQKNRRKELFSALDSGGEDVAALAARVHAKADQMSSPRYRALEFVRALAIPLIVSLLSGFAATAVIWDNPFRLDANLVMFGALVTIPTGILLTLAFVVHRRVVKAVLVVTCIAVIGILIAYQPRIVAGPVVSVDRPSAVILFHSETGMDLYAARIVDEMRSLPATMKYDGYEFPVATFVYRTDPDADYVTKAIRRNPFVRSVTKVNYRSRDDVVIRTEVPSLKAWQGLQIQRVQGTSRNSEFGETDLTAFAISVDYNLLLTTSTQVSALDHRLAQVSLGLGVSRSAKLSSDPWPAYADHLFATNVERFGAKLHFATTMAYGDFVAHGLGDVDRRCSALEGYDEISREAGFESVRLRLDLCLSEPDLASRLVTGSLEGAAREAAVRVFSVAALGGFAGLPEEVDRDGLLAIPAIDVAYDVHENCGTLQFHEQFEAIQQLSRIDERTARSARCLWDTLAARPDSFRSGLPEELAEAIARAFALGLIDDPSSFILEAGVDGIEWCTDLRDAFRDLVSFDILSPGADPIIDRWKTSACAAIETTPRLMRMYAYIDAVDWERLLEEHGTDGELDYINEELRMVLEGALDAFIGDSDYSTLYVTLLNQFIEEFNSAGGACSALLSMGPALESLGIRDANMILKMICDESRWFVMRPVFQAFSVLDDLPIGNAPILLKQLVAIGFGLEKAGNEVMEDLEDAPEWGREMIQRLLDYDANLAHLEKYFPEIDATATKTLAGLDSQPAVEQLAYLRKRLEAGNSRMLSAYLAEAYLSDGNKRMAISTFRRLIDDSDSRLRKDYYAMRVAELTGEQACARLGNHYITTGDVVDYNYYASALPGIGLNVLPTAEYLLLLSEAPPLDSYRKNASFGQMATAVYTQLDNAILDIAREDAPGIFLRLLLTSQFIESAQRDEALWARLQDVLSEENFHPNVEAIIREIQPCRQQ